VDSGGEEMRKLIVLVLVAMMAVPVYGQSPAPLPTDPFTDAMLRTIVDNQIAEQKVLQDLLDTAKLQLAAQQTTNDNLGQVTKSFGQTMADFGMFVTKYILPAVAAYIAGKKLAVNYIVPVKRVVIGGARW
jgi:hypothetical protein